MPAEMPNAMPGKPRIAVDLRALVGQASGIGFFTLAILQKLAERHLADYLGLSHGQVDQAALLEAAGVSLEREEAPFGVWWQQRNLPARLARGDVDLLWSPVMTLPRRLPVPAVVTVHDMTAVRVPESHRAKLRWSILPFLRRTLRDARTVCVDSQSTADDVRDYYPECTDRIRVVYPAIDKEFEPADQEGIARIRADLGCPEGYLLYAGTLEPRKNLMKLLDAWDRLVEDRPTAPPLVLAGPYGWRSKSLITRIQSRESHGLRYLGRLPRQRLIEVVQAARVFVYPSLYEGFGLPPAEAMACGIPTVVSDRSSLPEVVGEAGLLVNPEDPAAIRDAIVRILDDPELAEELGQLSLARAKMFDGDRAARDMEEVFVEALR